MIEIKGLTGILLQEVGFFGEGNCSVEGVKIPILKGEPMVMFKFNNGDVVKDQITGFKGVITARADYISGCVQYGVRPQTLTKEGKVNDSVWFDEDRLVECGKSISLKPKTSKRKDPPGGPALESHSRKS